MSKKEGKKKKVKEDAQTKSTSRGAGILLHITSLPSPFGIGDLGPEALAFADFLHESRQQYWQLLPLNPTEKPQRYSPYSATSSMAGNTLLISPDLLVKDGLLSRNDVLKNAVANKGIVDYEKAESIKVDLLNKAYANFEAKPNASLRRAYQEYCESEAAWLDDFALYSSLKKVYSDKPWYAWPSEHKLYNSKDVRKIYRQHSEAADNVKWLQFIFSRQWKALRTYCNNLGVSLIGDLPFYVSYDSADVWSNPEFFALDKNGNMTGVAGVPPDYFNADGQRWGMPVFRWDVLKRDQYEWWVKRLQKNVELFDLVRLDHFRAFADYWEVPAREKTAKRGKWQPGPGAEIFQVIEKELGALPFIAEDLGDINEPVYALRDQFQFPGMKVLQFAFGDNMPTSDYIPHNYAGKNFIVYTGTHDNNTTCGWYRKDIGKTERSNLSLYFGDDVTEKNIHLHLSELAYASIARIAILPMQDVLGLDETARMNTPASIENNWGWRMRSNEIKLIIKKRLERWVALYNR